jgi:DNA polymerase-3 subunit epsilon
MIASLKDGTGKLKIARIKTWLFNPRTRLGVVLALLFALQLLLIALVLLSLALDMGDVERAQFAAMLTQRGAQLAALALLLLCALGFAVNAWLSGYLVPLERLAEDVVLLGANPGHRAAQGEQAGRIVRILVEKINALADAHQTLHDDVQQKIADAGRALSEEKDRLAALMAELAQSVLVCNIEGRILLYNEGAKQLLEASSEEQATSVGLGRSVFGVLERGLIVHALEQVQHQLALAEDTAASGERARPVASFIATLHKDQMVRIRMAPVLDGALALNGFVLTLEDITRSATADNRRDALLQALTRDSRAMLANIRAAVETLHSFPDMDAAKKAQFGAIIDDESQRLALQIERAVQHDELDRSWRMEDMRGADLVALLRRRIDAAALRCRLDAPQQAIDGALWLNVDSYALSQALLHLARQLGDELGVRVLRLDLARAGRLAQLDLTWDGAMLAAETLRAWENTPLPSQRSESDQGLTLASVIAQQGGEAAYRHYRESNTSRYRLLLPAATAQAPLQLPLRQAGRPEFYDFDLFHQPGQNAQLDQRLLSQLSYTVFDTETTGLQPTEGDEIISIGALRIVNSRLLPQESFDQLVQPGCRLSAESIAIHGINDAMLKGQPALGLVLPRFHRYAEDTVLVAHNAAFDMRFLQLKEAQTGIRFSQPVLDTLLLSQVIHPHQEQHSLEAIAARLGVPIVGRHTALGDAIVTGEVFLKMLPLLAEKGILTLKQARDAEQQTAYASIRY